MFPVVQAFEGLELHVLLGLELQAHLQQVRTGRLADVRNAILDEAREIDLVADLRGQVDIAVAGHIDTTKKHGIRATFESVPDTPISSFVLEMLGGKKGLLENSANLCAHRYRGKANFDAQNGLTSDQKPLVATSCSKKKARKHRAKAHGRHRN